MTRLLMALPVALMLSCSGGNNLRCVDDGSCDGIAVCNDVGICEAVECTQPDQCDLGFTCDSTNSCVVGCDHESDCLAGETCGVSNRCQPYGCRTTTLDCEYGERCDAASGVCIEDTAPHCQPSCTGGFGGDSCANQSPGAVCACFDSPACQENYCLVQCNPAAADPCPRGYQCNQAFQGNPDTFCVADCGFINQF